MQISSDLSNPIQKLALQPQAPVEAGEGRERVPDNEAAEVRPSRDSLKSYQGTKIDITA